MVTGARSTGIRARTEPTAEKPQGESDAVPMTGPRPAAHAVSMTTQGDDRPPSYAVIWRTGQGPVRPGKLVLEATRLRLETGKPGGRSTIEGILYTDLVSIESAPASERIHGHPTTLVGRTGREPLAIAALDSPGSAHEIAMLLAGAAGGKETA